MDHEDWKAKARRRKREGWAESGLARGPSGAVPAASLGPTLTLLPELGLKEEAAVEAGPVRPAPALAGPAARISPARPGSASAEPQCVPRQPPLAQGPSALRGGGACSRGHPQGLSRHAAWLRAVSGQSERLRNPVVDREAGRGDPQLRPTELRTPVSELRGGGSEARTRPSASGSEAAGKAGGRGRPRGLGEPEEPRPQWGNGLPFLSIA